MAHANDMRSNISRSAYSYSVAIVIPFVNENDLQIVSDRVIEKGTLGSP